MSNPVLVEATRGNLVESRPRGMVIAVDGDGADRSVDPLAERHPRAPVPAGDAARVTEGDTAA